jgi:flagellar FliL protein
MRGGVNKAIPIVTAIIVVVIPVLLISIANVTSSALNRGGKSQNVVAEDDAYVGTRPDYSKFSALPVIRMTTKDDLPYSVVVELVLDYDLNDASAATELTSRVVELSDFLSSYFSSKYGADLQSNKVDTLKQDLMEKMNKLLNKAKIWTIYFKHLSTTEI